MVVACGAVSDDSRRTGRAGPTVRRVAATRREIRSRSVGPLRVGSPHRGTSGQRGRPPSAACRTVGLMPLTFVGTLDRGALLWAVDAVVALVSAPAVAETWDQESALSGMTVGGLTRHLVSQPECAVEFLGIQPVPPHAPTVSLADLYARTDWFLAPVDAAENTSIVDDFNAMAAGGPSQSVATLEGARAALPEAIAAAAPTTYVPWQDCCLATDDFLVVRMMEIVVHADDLAASVGWQTPVFDAEVMDPALALLATLSSRRHGQDRSIRALARAERSNGPAAAF